MTPSKRFDSLSTKIPDIRVPAANVSMRREVPVRPASVHSDVLVPALQSLISGVFVFFWFLFLLLFIGDVPMPGVIAGAIGFSAAVVVWFVHMVRWETLLWAVEEVTNADLDRNGFIGRPELMGSVEVKHQGHREYLFMPSRIRQRFVYFAKAVTGDNPRGLAIDAWDGYFGKARTGEPIYKMIVQQMHEREWVRWKNPRAHTHGRVLTGKGIMYLEAIAAGDLTPLMDGELKLLPDGEEGIEP